MKIVLVEWFDSATEYGWQRKDLFDDRITNCQSVGFLIKETDKVVVVTLNRSDNGRYADAITIPKQSIKRIRQLKCLNGR